jgi:hypothetical protein
MKRIARATMAALAMLIGAGTGHSQSADKSLERFREIYKELVETNTTLSAGDCTLAAKRMADRLKTAGYPNEDLRIFVPEGHPREGGLLGSPSWIGPECQSDSDARARRCRRGKA